MQSQQQQQQHNDNKTTSISMRKVKELTRESKDNNSRLQKEDLDYYYARSLRHEAKTLNILYTTAGKREDESQSQVKREKIDYSTKITYKVGKFLLETIGRLCFVDLFACDHFKSEANRIRFRWWPFSKLSNKIHFHRLDRSEWFKQAPRLCRLASRLVFSLSLLSCVHVLAFIIFQYNYDFHRFHLKRAQWLNRTHHEVYLELGFEKEDYLRKQVAASREAVLKVGALRGDFSFLPQCFCWLVLIVTLLCYVLAWLVTKYTTPFDFYFIRNFLEQSQEQHICRRLIKQQVHCFVKSSRSFTQALMEFSELSLGQRLFSPSLGVGQQVVAPGGIGRLASLLASEGAYWIREQQQQKQPASELDGAEPLISPLDSFSCRQMARMVARGHLVPVNQSAGWIARQIDRYAHMKLAIIAYCTLMDLILAWVLYAPDALRAPSWRDLLLASELLFLLTVCNVTTAFYSFTVMFCSYDQIQLVSKLRQLNHHVIALNKLRFYAILKPARKHLQRLHHMGGTSPNRSSSPQLPGTAPPPFHSCKTSQRIEALERRRGAIDTLPIMNLQTAARRPSLHACPNFLHGSSTAHVDQVNLQLPPHEVLATGELADKMNNDLLLAIAHYRIFFARMVSLVKPFGLVTFIATVLMFLVPFIGRLHLSYFLLPLERSVIVLSSCVILIPVNVALIGPAILHKRGLDLYGSLNSLLAHAIDITDHMEGRNIYDRHLISILRKELAMHDGIASRFATRAAGLSFTYPNLVRLYFYFGFLVLSIIAENQTSEQELTGTIFNDPFGLF